MRGIKGGNNQKPITASMRKCLPCLWALGFGKKAISKLTGIHEITVLRMRRKAGVSPSSKKPKRLKEREPKVLTKATQLKLNIELDDEAKRICSIMLNRSIYKRRTRTILKRQAASKRRRMKCANYRERCRAIQAKWTALNKEHVKALNKAYYHHLKKQNPERLVAYMEKAKLNPNYKLYRRNYRKIQRKNPKFRVVFNLRARLRQILKGSKKAYGTMKLIGCTRLELLVHIQSQFKPGMEWNNYGTHWHVDHIKPCASFDLSDPEQQRACFHYTNLQPLEAQENIRKGASLVWVRHTNPRPHPEKESFSL